MDLISLATGLVIGALAGAWGYRYMLKRDPVKLEMWAAEVKRKGQTLR